MDIWVKPNCREIKLNDLPKTVEKAESLGWVLKDEKPVVQTEEEQKLELEQYAKKEHGVNLDRRKKLETLQDEVNRLDEAAASEQ